jgi:hypothetical protein
LFGEFLKDNPSEDMIGIGIHTPSLPASFEIVFCYDRRDLKELVLRHNNCSVRGKKIPIHRGKAVSVH